MFKSTNNNSTHHGKSIILLSLLVCSIINLCQSNSILHHPITATGTRNRSILSLPSQVGGTTATHHDTISTYLHLRGGASDDSDVESDSDEYDESDEYDDEEEEEEEETLVKSTVKASQKQKGTKTKAVKKTINTTLLEHQPQKKKQKVSIMRKIPYILRVLMNPFTVIAMTKGYFASLMNIDYMKEDTSQSLRSALEEKAKKGGGSSGSGGAKRARKMRPGQAKTLSDLPQLNT